MFVALNTLVSWVESEDRVASSSVEALFVP
jgi:hypothetical protein